MNEAQKVKISSTERLVEAGSRGNRDAFDELVELYQRKAMQVAISILGNADEAAEAVQWPEVVGAVSGAHSLVLFLALGSALLSTSAKAVRWRLLFRASHPRLSLLSCISALLVGQLANNVLPARLGTCSRLFHR